MKALFVLFISAIAAAFVISKSSKKRRVDGVYPLNKLLNSPKNNYEKTINEIKQRHGQNF